MELLAPGGDIDSIKAAIAAGADAIYCGLDRFNARNRAVNIDFDDLNGIIKLAHRHQCKVFLTLNVIIIGSEIPALIRLLNKLVNTRIDGVIIQDMGLFYILSTYYKNLNIHASTQLNTHNEGQIKFLSKLNASRVNLARELNIHEIKALTTVAHNRDILTEVFVHGSYCISFSGICYMSSVHGRNSGNRGRCSQPCRDRYSETLSGKHFPLNLKDNSAFFDLKELWDAGVDSLKIEGRMKQFDYVYTVVNCWKKHIRAFYNHGRITGDNGDLYKVFNRDFSNGYLKGDIHKHMFIDDPMDHSIKHLSVIHDYSSNDTREKAVTDLFKEKADIVGDVTVKISRLSIEKEPLIITISGKFGTPLHISVQTPDTVCDLMSKANLEHPSKNSVKYLDYDFLMTRFKDLNHTGYYIKHLVVDDLEPNLFISFNELTSLKKHMLSFLNGPEKISGPVEIPSFKKKSQLDSTPDLGVLIASRKDLSLCTTTRSDIYFELPNDFKHNYSEFIEIFRENADLIPWFPSVLIGENYAAAVAFLEQIKPKRIVTDNTGIGYEAYNEKIPWIAGPYLNTANSFSLLALKELFNCSGACVSNEISKVQMKSLERPENFKLYYSIYHPVLLLTSRQCLFHQVAGCEKERIDDKCIKDCEKSTSIMNLKTVPLFINKTKGNHHRMYHHTHFLNTDIVRDFAGMYSGFFIDLRDIKTETCVGLDKSGVITLFENLLKGNSVSITDLKKKIHPTTYAQYEKGI